MKTATSPIPGMKVGRLESAVYSSSVQTYEVRCATRSNQDGFKRPNFRIGLCLFGGVASTREADSTMQIPPSIRAWSAPISFQLQHRSIST